MLKLIAFSSMLIDHIGLAFFPDVVFLRMIGRIALPLFCWGIARGFRHTKNSSKYLIRLSLLAGLSQIPYYLLFGVGYLNICFGLAMGLFILIVYESDFSLFIKITIISVLSLFSLYLNIEYGFYSILMILVFYIYWGNDVVIYYHFLLTVVSTLVLKLDPMQLLAIFSVFIILLLKNNKIRLPQLAQYAFYPVHLSVLLVIKNGGFL